MHIKKAGYFWSIATKSIQKMDDEWLTRKNIYTQRWWTKVHVCMCVSVCIYVWCVCGDVVFVVPFLMKQDKPHIPHIYMKTAEMNECISTISHHFEYNI